MGPEFTNLSRLRLKYRTKSPFSTCTPEFVQLEQEFGNHLLMNYDVQNILPNDIERFRSWYDTHSKNIAKILPDVAGPASTGAYTPLFRSINTYKMTGETVWEQNIRNDLFVEFPELLDKIMQLPFRRIPGIMLWSSNRNVNPHRDEGLFADIPMAFRAMIYDPNPTSTLYVTEAPSDAPIGPKHLVRRYAETNVFGWNNLRSKHGSFHLGHEKILALFHNYDIDCAKYRALIERSKLKYKPVIGKCSIKDFCVL